MNLRVFYLTRRGLSDGYDFVTTLQNPRKIFLLEKAEAETQERR